MSSDENEAIADDDADADEDVSAAVVDDDDDEDEGEGLAVAASVGDDEDEAMTIKSELTNDDEESKRPKAGIKRKRGGPPPGSRKGRTPAVQGLAIPFRAIKRTMKMDPDIGTVQNEAAIMTTMAAELFVKKLATQSHHIAKNKGRNTIRYEDVAEARTKDPALSFLETLIP
jgi:histone H3/H4